MNLHTKSIRKAKDLRCSSSYVALMSHIIISEPTMYEEASRHRVSKDAMIEEFQSIMKNDVWDIVPRHEGKSIVTSKQLFNIKHGANDNMEKMWKQGEEQWILVRLLYRSL